MRVIVFYKSPFFDIDTFILSQSPLLSQKMKIAAVSAVAQCFGAGKADFA